MKIVDRFAVRGIASVSSIALGLAVSTAQAQDSDAVVLDPVVIFGDRTSTEETVLTDVDVVTAEELDDSGISSFREAFRFIPNVYDADWVDGGFIIRGINSEGLTPGGAPLAAVYIDGIQQTIDAARRGARGTWDVEQIEVYKGAQSTLTGRAALAGAIYIKTADPVYETQAAVRGLVGNNEGYGGAFMLNMPIAENEIAIRIVGEYEQSETDLNYPDYEAFPLFERFSTNEYFQGRVKLLVEPAALPDTRALLTYSYSEDAPTIDDIGGPGIPGFNFADDRGDFNLPTFTEVRRAVNHNFGLEITHDFSDVLRLTSITGYNDNRTERPSINFDAEGETNIVTGDQNRRLLTQEVRLNYDGERARAVGGLYFAYFDSEASFERPNFFNFRADSSLATEESQNYAIFGEAAYDITPNWTFVAGGRLDYTTSDVTSNFTQVFFAGGQNVNAFAGSVSEFVALPKAGVIYNFDEYQSVGFTVQRGFRSGGISQQRSTGEVFDVQPEFTWNYELGYQGRFLNDRLSVEAAAFFIDWTDQQVEIQEDPADPASQRTVNAASSRLFGVEIEADVQVIEGLNVFGGLAYTDTEFLNFDDAGLGDLSGLPFPEAPEWSVVGGFKYETDIGLYFGADARYTSSVLSRFGQAPQEFVDEYFVANAQVGFEVEHFEVTLFANNLFDERYFVYSDNEIAATLGPRREFGVRVTAEF